MKLKLFQNLVEIGVKEEDTPSQRRGIIFSNCIAFILSAVNILLFIVIPQNHNLGGFREMLFAFVIFLIPVMLNHLRLFRISSLLLCWLPPVLIFWIMILGMKEASVVPVSSYVGLRIYLLATSCIPYLLLERKPLVICLLGIMPSLVMITFCDQLLDMAGVGFAAKSSPDSGYSFTLTRSLIAYIVIGGSCVALKFVVGKADKLNEQLIAELEKKNAIIQEQAESEVRQLNQQLVANIKEISKREFILQRSQEIAKVGSWEFNVQDKSIYWSDEMYDIFGIDKTFDIQIPHLTHLLFNESSVLIDQAHAEVIKKMRPYDFTLQTKTPIGYVKWVRVAGFPLIINDEVVGISGIVHDVTVFKEAEEKIKANEKNYRTLFEQASDAIVITDFSGHFIDINSSMCALLGYTREELLQMNTNNIFDPRDLQENPIQFDKLRAGEHIFNERRAIRKDGSGVFVEVNVKMFSEGKIMAIARDITNRKVIELEKERVRYDLNERVKELSILYRVSQILQTEGKPIHEALQEIVTILPAAWQYPKIAAARISIAHMEFVTPNFAETEYHQFSEFTTRNGLQGAVEVVYLEDKPLEKEGPFLAEERHLINMVANMIQIYLSQHYEAEALRRSEANQRATINNTSFHIWSVNHEYELISFNKISASFFYERFGVTVKVGSRVTEGHPELNDIRDRWTPRYNRALAGETFKIISDVLDRQFEYSLNPIIEENRIIGVTVFGEDITDRLKREKEIQEANKLISELQLMALRSVMNPHFIFNSLNAIQYYILENESRSAVMYLSTFSKLIRSILNNSVKAKVRLAEELEMIRYYIQMETMRFDERFDSVIHVDEGVDVENIEIPSMLIQPYVENAILHGLYNKKERGTLKVNVSLSNAMLLFEIEDDGIGREASGRLKQLKIIKHKSMGTTLTEERLKLINQKGQATVEIIDLEKGGMPAGTKVNIWVKW